MSRGNYRNGDEIDLIHNGCDGCSPCMVNGVLCHEQGCFDSWRDRQVDCFQCGFPFYPTERYQNHCFDCLNPEEDDFDPES